VVVVVTGGGGGGGGGHWWWWWWWWSLVVVMVVTADNGDSDTCSSSGHHVAPRQNARYVFISGARDVGSFHHDVSHVVAWQIEGHKRFCGLRCPSTLHPESERRKHGQTVSPPAELTEADVLAVSDITPLVPR